MSRWQRFISIVGTVRFIAVLGSMYAILAASRAIRATTEGGTLIDGLSNLIVVGIPGLLILYGGYRLPDTDLNSDTYPRVVAWLLGGFGLLLGVVGLRVLSPGVTIDEPLWSSVLATAIGSVAGLAIGIHEARAVSRAQEAEQQSQELAESKQRYQSMTEDVLDTSTVGTIVLDEEFQVMWANQAIIDFLGIDREALVGSDTREIIQSEIKHVFEDPDRVAETLLTAYEENTHVENFDCHVLSGEDRRERWLEHWSKPIETGLYTGGRIEHYHDITERKKHERELEESDRYRQQLYQITTETTLSNEEKIQRVLELGCDRFDVENGHIAYIDRQSGHHEIVSACGSDFVEAETETALEETYCSRTITTDDILAVYNAPEEGWGNDPAYERWDIGCYMGGKIMVHDDLYGTLCFVSREPRNEPFTELEQAFMDLMVRWVSHLFERRQHEQERQRYQDRLVRLNELAQELTDAKTEQAVSDLVVEAARETLSLPLIAIVLYDEESGELRRVTQTAAVIDLVEDNPLFESERGLLWRVFSDQTQEVCDDLREQADRSESDTSLRSAMLFPLGEHGVFIGGATTTDAFSDIDVSAAQILVATMRSALDRVEREQTVREQRDTLTERNAVLERVQRINSTIRGITTDLVQASTREEVIQAVCGRLVTAEAYRFAWIGTHDAVTDEVSPEAWAGNDEGYLETITVTTDESEDGTNPTGEAVQTHQTQTRNNLAADPPFDQWQQAALDRGYQASIAVPLSYQDTLYSVLTVYAGQPDVFNDLEEAVLTELGETIGYALNALERRQALVSEQSVELKFRLWQGDPPLFQFAAKHDCEFEFENIVQRADGPPGIFFTIRGVAQDEIFTFGENSPEIEDLTLVSDREREALFEARFRDSAFFSALLDRGAMPQTLTATGEEGYAVIRVPRTSNIRAFVELFEAQYDDVNLVGRREVDEPIKTQQEFEAEFRTRLTERQEEILQMAYASGFFDSPRETSAQELADMIGVSQPTVSRHIRAGERKLFGLVFGEE